jgi:xanthine dehydrogenase accessory factor
MDELREILTRIRRGDYQRAVLVTLVKREGSSYRRPGAKILITDRGDSVGSISGGCLETEIRRLAAESLRMARRIVELDTTSEEDAVFGFGLGCPGKLHLLFEPFRRGALPEFLHRLDDYSNRREDVALATTVCAEIPADRGNRLLISVDQIAGTLGSPALDRAAVRTAVTLSDSRCLVHELAGSRTEVFYELVRPAPRLVICGAGDDAIPLARIAQETGLEVLVVDPRESHASASRFPCASRLIVAQPETLPPDLAPDQRTIAVVMTHNYLRDFDFVRQLLHTRIGYIAVVGSAARGENLRRDLRSEGCRGLDRVYTPAGLDIGSETPAEIALAILAEAKAVLSRRIPTSLSLKLRHHLPPRISRMVLWE